MCAKIARSQELRKEDVNTVLKLIGVMSHNREFGPKELLNLLLGGGRVDLGSLSDEEKRQVKEFFELKENSFGLFLDKLSNQNNPAKFSKLIRIAIEVGLKLPCGSVEVKFDEYKRPSFSYFDSNTNRKTESKELGQNLLQKFIPQSENTYKDAAGMLTTGVVTDHKSLAVLMSIPLDSNSLQGCTEEILRKRLACAKQIAELAGLGVDLTTPPTLCVLDDQRKKVSFYYKIGEGQTYLFVNWDERVENGFAKVISETEYRQDQKDWESEVNPGTFGLPPEPSYSPKSLAEYVQKRLHGGGVIFSQEH